jgi:hypothetical protein
MSALPNLTVYSIDKLEEQHRAVEPFIRLFSVANQFTSTLAILAIPVSIFLSLAGQADFIRSALPAIAVFFCVMLAVVTVNAVLGMLNRISAIFFVTIVALHALVNLAAFGSWIYLATSSFGRVSVVSTLVLSACIAIPSCFLVYLYVRAFVAAGSMFRISASDRAILRNLPGGVTIPGKIWHQLRSLPPVFEFIGTNPHAIFVAALAQISTFLLAAAGLIFAFLAIALTSTAKFVTTYCWSLHSFSEQGGCAVGALIGDALALVVLVPLLFLFGALIQRLVRRLLRLSLEQLQKVDPRPPVLFLRAFRDDQVDLPPPSLTVLGWVMEFGHRKSNLDRVLLEEGTPYGPTVAIGKPDDKYPPYGAARGYFDNKTWQQAVGGLAHEAVAIVLCVDDTEGIWWEIEHLSGGNLLNKAFFIIHPRYAGLSQNTALTTRVLKAMGRDPSELGFPGTSRDTLGLYVGPDGALEVVQSQTFSRVALSLALRQFLRGKLGMKPVPLSDQYRRQQGLPAAEMGLANCAQR